MNYEISYNDLVFERKISEGGYGIVYRGKWKYTTVAIKEIKKEIIEQDKLEEFKSKYFVLFFRRNCGDGGNQTS